ncbi:MAG TPA: hypothetical protein V6D47_18515 [Oscillatoriaceae cyanobacterium]
MGGIGNLDMKLVAQGYDTNKNGRVDDELKIQAPGLADKSGKVTVDALANALSNDQVVVRNGAVVPGPVGQVKDIPIIHTLDQVANVSHQALGWGDPEYPGWQYQYTAYKTEYETQQVEHTRSDGSTYYTNEQVKKSVPYTAYHWGDAILDMRARLQSIADITSDNPDMHAQQIHSLATNALRQNDWEYWFDEGTAHSRYVAIYSSMQSINTLAEGTPNQPTTSVNSMVNAVQGAKGKIGSLQSSLNDPRMKSIAADTQKRIAAEEAAANKPTPLWAKITLIPWIFYAISHHGHSSTADRLKQDLATAQAAKPTDLTSQLSGPARQTYDTTVNDAWPAQTIEDANKLQVAAAPITNSANTIGNNANNQNQQVQDLLKTVDPSQSK